MGLQLSIVEDNVIMPGFKIKNPKENAKFFFHKTWYFILFGVSVSFAGIITDLHLNFRKKGR